MFAKTCAVLALAWLCCDTSWSSDLSSQPEAPASLEAWVEQLHSPAFAARQEATLGLKRLGARAFPKLIELAQGADADARSRAVQILEEHLTQGDAQLQEGAKAALEELAQGQGPGARAAERILNPPPAPDPNDLRRRMAGLQAMRAAQIQIQLQRPIRIAPPPPGLPPGIPALPQGLPPGLPGGQRERSISISISENGRTIKLNWKNEAIEIEVTELKNGQKVVEKYEAKNVEELKQKHPAGHDIYQKIAPRFGLPQADKND